MADSCWGCIQDCRLCFVLPLHSCRVKCMKKNLSFSPSPLKETHSAKANIMFLK